MKKELVTWMIILTFFSCNRPTTKDPCKEFKSLDIKIKEKGQQDRDKSLKMLNEVIRKQSGCIDAHLTRADLYVDLDSLQLAEEDYKRVLQIDADNIYALYQLGVVSNINGNHAASILYLEKAFDLKQKGGIVIDYKTDTPELSVDIYDIESSEIVYRLALAYYYKRDIKNAFKSLNFCIENGYLLSESYFYRGALYLETNQYAKACLDFTQSTEYGNVQAKEYKRNYCEKGVK
jgi:tetratricopeptide (TPR) repeat protein